MTEILYAVKALICRLLGHRPSSVTGLRIDATEVPYDFRRLVEFGLTAAQRHEVWYWWRHDSCQRCGAVKDVMCADGPCGQV